MGEAHALELGNGGVVDVAEFAHAVLLQSPAGHSRPVHVAEEPRQQLVDARPRTLGRRAAGPPERGHAFFRTQREIVADGALARAGSGSAVDCPVKPPAPLLRGEVFQIDDKAIGGSEQLRRDAQVDLGGFRRDGNAVRLLARTPRCLGPTPHRDLLALGRCPDGEEGVGGERQPNRRSFLAGIRRHQRRAVARRVSEGDEDSLLGPVDARTENLDLESLGRPRQHVAHFVRADGVVTALASARVGRGQREEKQNGKPAHRSINQSRPKMTCQGAAVLACRHAALRVCLNG